MRGKPRRLRRGGCHVTAQTDVNNLGQRSPRFVSGLPLCLCDLED
ncbi:MAG: hypothetical protein J07HQX50_00918 [Haloquadratum sp. J07HQX50]|nr:MAG: hypothetical protein J07HQX50_00918 [Haloquadratum sp. J07HQX50]